jgi:ubiquinol oxidase
MYDDHVRHEELVASLNDQATLKAYKEPLDRYQVGIVPRVLGELLICIGTLVYGESPSYAKFRAIEVIARVPYHSWSSALFTLLTLFYQDEKRALRLSTLVRFARLAASNETMHVVVISKLSALHQPCGAVRHTLMPMLFAFVYFWFSYLLYLLCPRWSLEINYLFEDHAFSQYDRFLTEHEDTLKKAALSNEFLTWYGRAARSEYEFFRSVRNDELIHRNQSIHEIALGRS